MPARLSDNSGITISTYAVASAIPGSILQVLQNDPRATLILPTIESRLRNPDYRPSEDEFWMACFSTHQTPSGPQTRLDFVLACTVGYMGKYPIFIYSPKFTEELDEAYLEVRIMELVRELARRFPDASAHRRVYSVFAVKPVATAFVRHWTARTGIAGIEEPYYDAKFSYCTLDGLAEPRTQSAIDHMYEIVERPADMADVDQVRHLCQGFAGESPPFELSPQRAEEEARKLITARQLWVLEVTGAHMEEPEIACIVALTRSTRSVATITKVYTLPRWRKKGFAFRLVRHVCNQLLNVDREKKNAVVLYVGNENPARFVYDKVGFVGLGRPNQGERFKHVEGWLEIGFDRSRVELGHW